MSDNKYTKAALPRSQEEAIQMAEMREEWAEQARKSDLHGTAKEQELTALLLRAFAAHI